MLMFANGLNVRKSLLNWPCFELQLHDAIYRLRFYSNSLIHILPLSNLHINVASIQKNWGDKSHCVIVALGTQNFGVLVYALAFDTNIRISSPLPGSFSIFLLLHK